MISNNAKINSLVKDLISECQVDYEGLWVIVSNVKREQIATSPAEVRAVTFEIVRALLKEGMLAGNFYQKNPQVSKLSSDEIITMIDQEWTKLGRNPTIGEIIAFTSPSFLPKIIEPRN